MEINGFCAVPCFFVRILIFIAIGLAVCHAVGAPSPIRVDQFSRWWASRNAVLDAPAAHPKSRAAIATHTSPRWPPFSPSNWCLLLSTTVRTNVDLSAQYPGQQRDPTERIRMYSRVLRHWMVKYPRVPITVVENSGDDLAWARAVQRDVAMERVARKVRNATILRPTPLALVGLRPATSRCGRGEIGCHEARAVHLAMKQSIHLMSPCACLSTPSSPYHPVVPRGRVCT